MTRRRILILFVIMAFIAITATILILKEPSPDSNLLNIYLRCDEGVSGTLSVIPLVPDCKGRLVEENFDVKAACEEMSLEYSYYRGRAGVLFTLEHDNGEITGLTSEYGADILWERNLGFTVMIRILNVSPFLVNDGI